MNREGLFDCLRLMVEETHKNSTRLAEFSKSLSKTHFLKEFRTVKFGLGRQMGHTTMAMQLRFPWAETIVFVPQTSLGYLQLRYPAVQLYAIHHNTRSIPSQIPRLFVIDPVQLMSNIDAVYEAATIEDFIVLLE